MHRLSLCETSYDVWRQHPTKSRTRKIVAFTACFDLERFDLERQSRAFAKVDRNRIRRSCKKERREA
jgi:hypothetical protein